MRTKTPQNSKRTLVLWQEKTEPYRQISKGYDSPGKSWCLLAFMMEHPEAHDDGLFIIERVDKL